MDLISGNRRGAWAAVLRFCLWYASLWFWLAANLRLAAYRLGILRGQKVSVPVICVGNLTTGGTGKTPAVAAVVRLLHGMGRKPAIVSRGYKAVGGANDEMRVLDELCPGVTHIQNPDRVAGAEAAIQAGADVIVLDDGFSHLRLKRDLDILLFDALNPFGFARMLPRGLLREPIRSVRRAKFAILTRADVATADRLRDLEDTIRCKGFVGEVAHAAHRPVKLVRLSDSAEEPITMLSGRTVAPFCGIGNPLGFRRTLELLKAEVSRLDVLRLDDHQHFDEAAFTRQVLPFIRASDEAGASIAVCTQKDAVKLRDMPAARQAALPIYELRVEFALIQNAEALTAACKAVLAAHKP